MKFITFITLVISFLFLPYSSPAEAAPVIKGQSLIGADNSADTKNTYSTISQITASSGAKFVISKPDVKVVLPPPPPPPPVVPNKSYSSAGSSSQSRSSSGSSSKVWYESVNLTGGQGTVDRCAGSVWQDYGSYGRVVAEHNHCGGAWILNVQTGQTVVISGYGSGTYRVTGSKSVPKGASAAVLNGGMWLQTCYFNSDSMRLVHLEKIG